MKISYFHFRTERKIVKVIVYVFVNLTDTIKWESHFYKKKKKNQEKLEKLKKFVAIHNFWKKSH